MDTKLTLKLNEKIILKAKKYAEARQISLSKMIENYLHSLTMAEHDDFPISPFVKSIATGQGIPDSIDDNILKEEYLDFIEKKHQ